MVAGATRDRVALVPARSQETPTEQVTARERTDTRALGANLALTIAVTDEETEASVSFGLGVTKTEIPWRLAINENLEWLSAAKY